MKPSRNPILELDETTYLGNDAQGDSIYDMCDILTNILMIIHYDLYLVHFWNVSLESVANYFVITCFEKKFLCNLAYSLYSY